MANDIFRKVPIHVTLLKNNNKSKDFFKDITTPNLLKNCWFYEKKTYTFRNDLQSYEYLYIWAFCKFCKYILQASVKKNSLKPKVCSLQNLWSLYGSKHCIKIKDRFNFHLLNQQLWNWFNFYNSLFSSAYLRKVKLLTTVSPTASNSSYMHTRHRVLPRTILVILYWSRWAWSWLMTRPSRGLRSRYHRNRRPFLPAVARNQHSLLRGTYLHY